MALHKEWCVQIACITAAYEATLILELVRAGYAVQAIMTSKKISFQNPDSGGIIMLRLDTAQGFESSKVKDDLIKIMQEQE